MFKKVLLLLLVLTQSGCISLSASEEIDITSLCKVLANPKDFDGKTVSVRARVDSDYAHFVLLKDDTCPLQGLPLGHERQPNAKSSSDFDVAMENKRKKGGVVSAVFTGVVSYLNVDFPHAEINTTNISDVRYSR